MKKTVFTKTMMVGMALMLITAFSSAWAACGTSVMIANRAIGGQLNVPGILDDGSGNGSIITKFWLQGNSENYNSGKLETIYQVEPREENSYYIWSDWGDAKVVGDCPPNDGRTVFLYSIENNGAGEYILLSTAMDTVTTWSFDFDAVTNGDGIYDPSTENAVAIPTPLVTNVVQDTPGVVTAVLNWPAITNLKGFYDKEPGKNLITGIVVRYYQAGMPPVIFKASDWPVADVINIGEQGTDPGEVTVKVPYTRGMRTFVALSLLFDGGKPALDSSPAFTETVFIGHPVEVKLDTGPAPTAEFGFIKRKFTLLNRW